MVTTVGLGDIKACTPAEEVLASFQMLLGVFLFGLIVSTSQYVLPLLLTLFLLLLLFFSSLFFQHLLSEALSLSFFLIGVVVSASQFLPLKS